MRFMMMRAENFVVLRRKPIEVSIYHTIDDTSNIVLNMFEISFFNLLKLIFFFYILIF